MWWEMQPGDISYKHHITECRGFGGAAGGVNGSQYALNTATGKMCEINEMRKGGWVGEGMGGMVRCGGVELLGVSI